MGLLDDAIREHLELKRRRGADPDVVAREEREVLVSPESGADAEPTQAPPDLADAAGAGEEPPAAALGSAHEGDLAHTSEETVELDMRTVLENDQSGQAISLGGAAKGASTGQRPVPAGAHSSNAAPSTGDASPDSVEWEVPGDPRKKGDSESQQAAAGAPEDAVEDVLEETPDFLRETPDQDRLWFEQQPPRDFDFGK
jgi:hypothetical protein